MIKLNPSDIIKENKESKKDEIQNMEKEDSGSNVRPEVVDAKVYKLKSAFVKNSVLMLLGKVTDFGFATSSSCSFI